MSKIYVARPGEDPWLIDDSTDLGKVSLQDALDNGAQGVNKEKDEKGGTKFELIPDSDWTVKEIRKYMSRYNIKYGARDKKADLLSKIKDG